jgi:drug/metabolite transporter (DMT)-like permease
MAAVETKPTAPAIDLVPFVQTLLGGIVIAFSPILVRYSDVGPVATGAWRMAFALAFLLPYAGLGIANRSFRQISAWPIVAVGVFFAADLAFFHTAILYTSVAHAALIANMAPLIVVACGIVLFGESRGAGKLLGLALAVGGGCLMAYAKSGAGTSLYGDGLAAIALVAYAFYLVAVKQARRAYDSTTIMIASSAVSVIALILASMAMGEVMWPSTSGGLVALAGLGLVHVFGQGLITVGMRGMPVGLASIVLLVQPVAAGAVAYALFGETLNLGEMAGAFALLTGIALASAEASRRSA